MTSAPASSETAFVHELLLHSSPAEMLAFVLPFVRDGMAAQEPTMLLVRPETAVKVRPLLGPSPYLTLLPALGWAESRAATLRAAANLLTAYGPEVPRVRVLSQVPTVPGGQWHEWRRLEAAVNVALGRHRAWVVCGYDRRELDDEMISDLHATHRLVGWGDQHRTNLRYEDPFDFAAKHLDAEPDPAESSAPAAELLNPTPSIARSVVEGFARHTSLPPLEIENLVVAVHEAVVNSLIHGRPPVVLRLWLLSARMVVTVTDTGPGPADPLVGMVPPRLRHGPGLGLWLCHQLVDVTHRRHPDGYTICLSSIRPPQRAHVSAPIYHDPTHDRRDI